MISWMMVSRLHLNPTKTGILWCSSSHHQHQIPAGPAQVGSMLPVSVFCYLDADVTMSAHITATVRACFAALWQIRSVRRSLTQDALLKLIHALVIMKLDFCCSALVGVSGSLQSVLNAAARLVFSTRRSEHTTLHSSVNFAG